MTTRSVRVHPNLSEEELEAIDNIKSELGLASRADVVRMALHAFFKERGIEIAKSHGGRKADTNA